MARYVSLEQPLKIFAYRAAPWVLPTAPRELAENNKADVPKSCSPVTDGGSAIRRRIAHHVKGTVRGFMQHIRPETSAILDVRIVGAVRTSAAITSLPEGRRRNHSHDSPFRYVFLLALYHSPKFIIDPLRFSFVGRTWETLRAPPCRMSAALRFNPNMRSSFDCRTLERCSTPTLQLCFCSLHAWSPAPQWDSFQKRRHMWCSLAFSVLSFTPRIRSAEKINGWFSVEFAFDQSSFICRCLFPFSSDCDFFFLHVKMLNIPNCCLYDHTFFVVCLFQTVHGTACPSFKLLFVAVYCCLTGCQKEVCIVCQWSVLFRLFVACSISLCTFSIAVNILNILHSRIKVFSLF